LDYPNYEVNHPRDPFERNLHSRRRRRQDECFGLPNSKGIASIVFGILIIFWGLSIYLDWEFNIMAFIAIIFGTLVVVGAVYKLRQK
jgi:hypothetical protein